MAILTIPKAGYAVLERFAALPDAVFLALAAALKEAETTTVDLDLSKALVEKLKPTPGAEIKSIIRTLTALSTIKEYRNRSIEEVLNDLKETIEADKPENLDTAKTQVLLGRLKQILEAGGGINMLVKTKSVILAHERTYCGSKILSDLRPIFFDSPDRISAAVLIHTVNISYHQNGEHKHFYVAMNPTDLEKLKGAIERAERKAKALRSYVDKSGIRYLEDTE